MISVYGRYITDEWADFMWLQNRTVLNSICTQDLSSLSTYIFCCTSIGYYTYIGLRPTLPVTDSNS